MKFCRANNIHVTAFSPLGRAGIVTSHSTDVETPAQPPPCICVSIPPEHNHAGTSDFGRVLAVHDFPPPSRLCVGIHPEGNHAGTSDPGRVLVGNDPLAWVPRQRRYVQARTAHPHG